MGKDNFSSDLPQVLLGNAPLNQVHTMSAEMFNQSDSNGNLPSLSNLNNIEVDCTLDSNIISPISPSDLFSHPRALTLERSSSSSSSSSFSSSSEDEDFCSHTLAVDPGCTKKFEQALKLGYCEKNVEKVLRELGDECGINDLLSGLIKLEVSNPENLLSQALPPDVDIVDSDSLAGTTVAFRCGVSVAETSLDSGSLGSNSLDTGAGSDLHYIIIDGSNVAMSHGKNLFSCRGIQIAVDWFQARGHTNITVFVPQWRKEASRPDAQITDQEILYDLEKQGIVVFTPARRVKGRRVVCYDDRFILKLAVETGGIVVSNDVYRDLIYERQEFQHVVDHKLLMYSFVNDRFMPPEDPLGRLGPNLDDFLRKTPAQPHPRPQDCPYGKKCTYGNKCRFFHPERGFAPQKSITEVLKEQAHIKLQERTAKTLESAERGKRNRHKLSRTKSVNPVESSASSLVKNRNGKPKLVQSKSVMLPDKSSDYLNEPRRKLEEAEQAALLEQIAVRDSPLVGTMSLNVFDSSDSDKRLKLNVSNTDILSIQQSDTLMQSVFDSESQLKPASSSNVLNSSDSFQTSPVFQNMPSLEMADVYVSGPLLATKNVLPESQESRSSPVLVSGVLAVQKLGPSITSSSEPAQLVEDFNSGKNVACQSLPISVKGYSHYQQPQQQKQQSQGKQQQSLQQQEQPLLQQQLLQHPQQHLHQQQQQQQHQQSPWYHHQQQQQQSQWHQQQHQQQQPLQQQQQPLQQLQQTQQQNAYMLQKGHSPMSGSSTGVDTYDVGSPVFHDSGVMLPPYRLEVADGLKFSSYSSSETDPRSVDSGVFTSPEGMSRPYTNYSENQFQIWKSYPSCNTQEGVRPQQLVKFHRAYSSTDNIKGEKDSYCLRPRRMSSLTISSFGDEHFVLNQPSPHGIPVQPASRTYKGGQILNRQSSFSDPQIHNCSTERFPDVGSSINSDAYVSHLNTYLSSQNQHFPKQLSLFKSQNLQQNYHQEQVNSFNMFTRQQQHQIQSPKWLVKCVSEPGNDTWGQSVHDNIDQMLPSGATVIDGQYSPYQSVILCRKPSPVSPGPATQGLSMPVTAASHIHKTTQPQNTSHYSQSTIFPPAVYAASTAVLNSVHAGTDIHSHSIYSQPVILPQTNIQVGLSTAEFQTINEDAVIQATDVRYPIYYHLSSVFGEQIVRKVLNLNPQVFDPAQICQLLIKYREAGK